MTNDTINQKFIFRALPLSIQDRDVEFIFLILNSVLTNDTIIQKFVFRALPFSIQYTETSIPITESLELKRRINLWKNRQVYIYRQREEKRQGSINIKINPAVRG